MNSHKPPRSSHNKFRYNSTSRVPKGQPVDRPSIRHNAGLAESWQRDGGSRDCLAMGRNCVEALLMHKPTTISKAYVLRGGDGRLFELKKRVRELGVPLVECEADDITLLCGSDSHQGIAFLLKDPGVLDLKQFISECPAEGRSFVIALDGVQDPHNFGAIMRAAECFGASAVMWSKNRGAGLTPVARKSSVGASEILKLVQVSNLAQALERLKEHGFWVVAADSAEGADKAESFKFPERSVIILGAEGEGLRELSLKKADFVVKIPMVGKTESLNVSQAAAVLCYLAAQGTALAK